MSTGPINFGNIQKPNIDELLDKRAQLTEEIKTEKEGNNIFADAADNSNEAAPAAAEPEYENAALDEAEAAFDEAQDNYNAASDAVSGAQTEVSKAESNYASAQETLRNTSEYNEVDTGRVDEKGQPITEKQPNPAYAQAKEAVKTAENALEQAKAALDSAQEAQEQAQQAMEDAATKLQDEVDNAQETPEETQELQEAEDTRLEELQAELDEVNEEIEEIKENKVYEESESVSSVPVTPDEPIPGDEPPAISDDDLIRITLPTPPVLNKSNDQESDGIENDFKNEIFNEDGTFNRDRTQELMESGKMTVDQFIKACGYDLTNEADRKAIKYKENGDFKFVLEDETEISGNNTGYSTGYSTIPPYLRIYQDGEYSIIDEQKYDFKSEIFNEDGELDIDRTQELMESGEMTVDQFIKACGYDLMNEDDQIAINLTRSNTFEYTLEDGTVVSGRDSWDFMGNPPFILLETPYGDYLIKEGSKEDSEDDSELEEDKPLVDLEYEYPTGDLRNDTEIEKKFE